MLSYCLTICVASAAHAASLPDIWITPIPHVPWFHPDAEAPVAKPAILHLPTHHKHEHSKSSFSSTNGSEASCAVSKYIAERWEKLSRTERQPVSSSGPILFTKGRQSADSTRPTWARQHRIRRGVDDPFAKPLPKPVVLAPPPRAHSRQVVAPRDSHCMELSEQRDTRSYSTVTPRISSVFPQQLVDPDLPIPCPKRSEWVRADALSWITFDTKLYPSP